MIPGAAVRHQDHRMTGLRLSIPEARPILLWISGMSVVRFRLHLWDCDDLSALLYPTHSRFTSARLSNIFPEHPFNVTLAREHDHKLFAASPVLPCHISPRRRPEQSRTGTTGRKIAQALGATRTFRPNALLISRTLHPFVLLRYP
jgi:hypothetical protein